MWIVCQADDSYFMPRLIFSEKQIEMSSATNIAWRSKGYIIYAAAKFMSILYVKENAYTYKRKCVQRNYVPVSVGATSCTFKGKLLLRLEKVFHITKCPFFARF